MTTLLVKMPSSGMLCRVALVRTDVSEECIASIIRVERISRRGIMLAVRATPSNLPEGGIRHSHRRENFSSHTTILLSTVCYRYGFAYFNVPQAVELITQIKKLIGLLLI
jgi:hypothetical protein